MLSDSRGFIRKHYLIHQPLPTVAVIETNCIECSAWSHLMNTRYIWAEPLLTFLGIRFVAGSIQIPYLAEQDQDAC